MSAFWCILLVMTTMGIFVSGQNFDLILSGRNFDNGGDFFGPPDPFVKVSYAIGQNPFNFVGQTETVETTNPDWVTRFNFHYVPHLNQKVKFEIMDEDTMYDDELGTVTVSIDEMMQPPDGVLIRHFGRGSLIINRILLSTFDRDKS